MLDSDEDSELWEDFEVVFIPLLRYFGLSITSCLYLYSGSRPPS
jgi:hypothetical protein